MSCSIGGPNDATSTQAQRWAARAEWGPSVRRMCRTTEEFTRVMSSERMFEQYVHLVKNRNLLTTLTTPRCRNPFAQTSGRLMDSLPGQPKSKLRRLLDSHGAEIGKARDRMRRVLDSLPDSSRAELSRDVAAAGEEEIEVSIQCDECEYAAGVTLHRKDLASYAPACLQCGVWRRCNDLTT